MLANTQSGLPKHLHVQHHYHSELPRSVWRWTDESSEMGPFTAGPVRSSKSRSDGINGLQQHSRRCSPLRFPQPQSLRPRLSKSFWRISFRDDEIRKVAVAVLKRIGGTGPTIATVDCCFYSASDAAEQFRKIGLHFNILQLSQAFRKSFPSSPHQRCDARIAAMQSVDSVSR